MVELKMTGANELNVSLGLNGFRFENPNPWWFFYYDKTTWYFEIGPFDWSYHLW